MSELGVYSIAYFLSHAIIQTLQTLASKILFPVFSLIIREKDGSLLEKSRKIRLALMITTLPLICFTVIFGNEIINLLYDVRYKGAGWMLQILGTGAIIEAINITLSPILLASGDSFRHMIVNSLKTIFLFGSMITGGYYWGTPGLIMGIPVSYLLTYPVTAIAVKKYGVWTPIVDLLGFLFSMVVISFGLLLF
jgi:O-antigen/teichoic acid export membrane protein